MSTVAIISAMAMQKGQPEMAFHKAAAGHLVERLRDLWSDLRSIEDTISVHDASNERFSVALHRYRLHCEELARMFRYVEELVSEVPRMHAEPEPSNREQVMTSDEMDSRFPSEWVLIAEPVADELNDQVTGRVVWHSPDREEVYRKKRELDLASAAILFVGPWPDDLEFAL